ncbi:acyl-CoA dehydrogenase family protein [Bosea sp. (in: a-proteobacteria)]|uniref:acyl-CoA dehydrogenase family protein n=1 Tax=Bosea sp. (in: a-proteobacteria) TaxID=1871050 RepID=UPI002DDD8ABF|nr:acyl-CoA dehydrogenase family protein [Bosea sp. (in: a-proteobacteria)]HEV2512141.1 acyl-CoA dehydrogenase family protein [Bosea sp. (in: a-proteobacteria)]
MLQSASPRREGGPHESEDGTYASEELLLRETVRRFMTNDVRPAEEGLPHDAYKLPKEQLDRLQKKARELGLWNVQSPEEHGGAGLSLVGQVIVAEEAAKCRMGAYIPACGAFGFDPPSVIFRGSQAQIEKYARPAIERGEKAFFAISEPSGGSDPARAIRTTARREGDEYVLNGTKFWITAANESTWGIVFARVGAEKSREGITCFIVDMNRPGVSHTVIPVIRSYAPFELHFENYRIPVENRIGEEGQGFQLVNDLLVHGRVPYAAGTIGVAQAALELAIDWAKQRQTFGALLADRQAIQWMLADSEIELRAARLLVLDAARRADAGQDIKMESSVAKVFATETAGRVVDRCIQILGGMGVAQEMPLERWYREMRIKRIGEGPSEVQRLVVARNLLGSRTR